MAQSTSPLVGRENELDRLGALLDDLESGVPASVAVEGEPGIGKTRLLAELRTRAAERGFVVLDGSGAEFERDLPFGLWVDALDAHVAGGDWEPELADGLAAVAPSLPGEGGVATVPGTDQRHRTHRAVRRVLGLLAEQQPLVVVLDDVHWADGASVDLIAALLRRPPSAPVLLAVGYRTGKAPLKLRSSLAVPSVTTVELDPLGEDDAAALMDATFADAQRAAIYGESGGNPFYILQLARASQIPARSSSGDRVAVKAGVPRVVAAALMEELGTLSLGARTLVGAAAVAGDPFHPDLAFEIGQLDPDTGAGALDELLESGLVHSTDIPRLFEFRHPLVRRAVYESVRGGWRLAAHARAAAAMAARGAPAAARAHHVEQSAAAGDTDAVAVLLEAGNTSAPRAPSTAARWYTAALRIIPEADVPTRLQALIGRANVLQGVGDLAECRASLLDAVSLLPPDDASTRLELLSALGAVDNFMGRHEESRTGLLAMLEQVEDQGSREAVTMMLDLAGVAFFLTDVELMNKMAASAVEASRGLGDEVLLCSSTAMLGHAAALAGDLDRAAATIDEAAGMLDSLRDDDAGKRLGDLNRLGWAEFYFGRYEDSIVHCKRGVELSRALGQTQFVPFMTQAQALSTMLLGRLDEAAALQADAIEVARLAANDYITCAVLITSSMIARLQGDVEAALVAAEESVERSRSMDPGLISAFAAAGLAVTIIEAGGTARDPDAVVAATGGWDLPLLPLFFRVVMHEARTRTELEHERRDEAERSAARAEAAAEELGLGVGIALAQRARAALFLADGDAGAAAKLALTATDGFDAAGAQLEAARARVLAGRALAEQGDRERAIELLKAAESEADHCGALRVRGEVRRDLRKLGARAEKRGRAGAGDSGLESLSRREREIAELVTDRKTNREVAAELFLSEKTVETHLRNTFFKLGASSRVEVARIVEHARRD